MQIFGTRLTPEEQLIKTLQLSTLRRKTLKYHLGELLLSDSGQKESAEYFTDCLNFVRSKKELFSSYCGYVESRRWPECLEEVAHLIDADYMQIVIDHYYTNQRATGSDTARRVKKARILARYIDADYSLIKLLFYAGNVPLYLAAAEIVDFLHRNQNEASVQAGARLIAELRQMPSFPDFLKRVVVNLELSYDDGALRGIIRSKLSRSLLPPPLVQMIASEVGAVHNSGQLMYILEAVTQYERQVTEMDLLPCVNQYADSFTDLYIEVLKQPQNMRPVTQQIKTLMEQIAYKTTYSSRLRGVLQIIAQQPTISEQNIACLNMLARVYAIDIKDCESTAYIVSHTKNRGIQAGTDSCRHGCTVTKGETEDAASAIISAIMQHLKTRIQFPGTQAFEREYMSITEVKNALDRQLQSVNDLDIKQLVKQLIDELDVVRYPSARLLVLLRECCFWFECVRHSVFDYALPQPIRYERVMRSFEGTIPLFVKSCGGGHAASYRETVARLQRCYRLAQRADERELLYYINEDLALARSTTNDFYYTPQYVGALEALENELERSYLRKDEDSDVLWGILHALRGTSVESEESLHVYTTLLRQLQHCPDVGLTETRQKIQRIVELMYENQRLSTELETSGIAHSLQCSRRYTPSYRRDETLQDDAPTCKFLNYVKRSLAVNPKNSYYDVQEIATFSFQRHPRRLPQKSVRSLSVSPSPPRKSATPQRAASLVREQKSPLHEQVFTRLKDLLDLYKNPENKANSFTDVERKKSHDLINLLANSIVKVVDRAAFSQQMNIVRRHFIQNCTKLSKKQLVCGIKLLKLLATDCGVVI